MPATKKPLRKIDKRGNTYLIAHEVQASFAASSTMEENGVATRKYVKDLIAVGEYIHPMMGWRVDVTPELLEQWANKFSEMIAAGLTVPFVKDHFVSTESTLGYVTDVYVDGDKLFGVIEVRGEDNIETTHIVDQVSINVEHEFIDGKGKNWGEAITHVGLTPAPVVSGQSSFVPFGRNSGESRRIPVYSLSRDSAETSFTMNKELRDAFKEFVKAKHDATEDEILSALKDELLALQSKVKTLEEEKATKAEEKPVAGTEEKSAETKPAISDDELESRAGDVTQRIDRMVESGKLVPAKAASLRAALCGEPEKRNSYMLSRVAKANDKGIRPLVALSLLDTIESCIDEGSKAIGEKTANQSFGRTTSNGESNPEDMNKAMDRIAGMTPAATGFKL